MTVLLLVVGLIAGNGAALGQTELVPCVVDPSTLPTGSVVTTTALPECAVPGVLLVVGDGGVGVPPPGFGAGALGLDPLGNDYLLMVETSLAGEVLVRFGLPIEEASTGARSTAFEQTAPAVALGTGECDDNAFNLNKTNDNENMKWYSMFRWYYKSGSAPPEVDEATAIERLRDGVRNITQVNNNCGRADNVSATSNYEGTTTKSVDMPNGTNNCATFQDRDGTSVISFGDAGGTYAGWTCWWYTEHSGADELVESDVRLDKNDYQWTTSPGAPGCSGKYSIEAVTTHERGHSFGLWHVSESSHPNLTMSTSFNGFCQNSEASLGLGDMLGLETLY